MDQTDTDGWVTFRAQTRTMDNLRRLQRNGTLCDAQIRSNGEVIPVHRCVLAASSPLLLRRLASPSGCPAGVLEIEVPAPCGSSLRPLVSLVYGEEVTLPRHAVDGFLRAARSLGLNPYPATPDLHCPTPDPEVLTPNPISLTLAPNDTNSEPDLATIAPKVVTPEPDRLTLAPKVMIVDPGVTAFEPDRPTLAPMVRTLGVETSDLVRPTLAPEVATYHPAGLTLAPKVTTLAPQQTTPTPKIRTSDLRAVTSGTKQSTPTKRVLNSGPRHRKVAGPPVTVTSWRRMRVGGRSTHSPSLSPSITRRPWKLHRVTPSPQPLSSGQAEAPRPSTPPPPSPPPPLPPRWGFAGLLSLSPIVAEQESYLWESREHRGSLAVERSPSSLSFSSDEGESEVEVGGPIEGCPYILAPSVYPDPSSSLSEESEGDVEVCDGFEAPPSLLASHPPSHSLEV
ncbi:protein FAM186A-like [Leucoraja erinacea]|uniref:protein FAM186A-like n=1 Tax=Leucoraja erinaceus TaxID=7782 RepID=UPI002456AD71|nr:protein FAM186A-like [Leucoraja erinacea]